jgi:hypothetical protein
LLGSGAFKLICHGALLHLYTRRAGDGCDGRIRRGNGMNSSAGWPGLVSRPTGRRGSVEKASQGCPFAMLRVPLGYSRWLPPGADARFGCLGRPGESVSEQRPFMLFPRESEPHLCDGALQQRSRPFQDSRILGS